MLGKPRILSLFPNSFNKLNKHGHSCKILYLINAHADVSSGTRLSICGMRRLAEPSLLADAINPERSSSDKAYIFPS